MENNQGVSPGVEGVAQEKNTEVDSKEKKRRRDGGSSKLHHHKKKSKDLVAGGQRSSGTLCHQVRGSLALSL